VLHIVPVALSTAQTHPQMHRNNMHQHTSHPRRDAEHAVGSYNLDAAFTSAALGMLQSLKPRQRQVHPARFAALLRKSLASPYLSYIMGATLHILASHNKKYGLSTLHFRKAAAKLRHPPYSARWARARLLLQTARSGVLPLPLRSPIPPCPIHPAFPRAPITRSVFAATKSPRLRASSSALARAPHPAYPPVARHRLVCYLLRLCFRFSTWRSCLRCRSGITSQPRPQNGARASRSRANTKTALKGTFCNTPFRVRGKFLRKFPLTLSPCC